MTTEDRLRDALHAEAATVEPRDAWATIESRLGEPVPRRRGRPLAFAAAAALLVVAAVVVVAQTSEDEPTPVITEPRPTTSLTVTSDTAPAPTTTTPDDFVPHQGAIWTTSAATPRAIAEAFARDFLEMQEPHVGEYREGDARSGEVVVRPRPTSTQTTTVSVRRFDDAWFVIAANADNLELDEPAARTVIRSPLRLTGRSTSFEGNVRVAVLRLDTTMQCTRPTDVCGSDPGVYANTYFTGGSMQKEPFSTEVRFSTPRASDEYGVVVLWTESAENGLLSEATVRLIRFR